MMAPVVVEGAHPQPLGAQQVEVDVGDRASFPAREAFRFGKQAAVLVDHRLAVPGEIRARLPFSGSGIDVGGQTTRRGRSGQQLAIVGAADGDRAAGQIGQHGGTGQCGLRAGRHRDEHVLADLHMQHQPGHVIGGEEQIRSERDVRAEKADRPAHVVAGGDLAAFVELTIGR